MGFPSTLTDEAPDSTRAANKSQVNAKPVNLHEPEVIEIFEARGWH